MDSDEIDFGKWVLDLENFRIEINNFDIDQRLFTHTLVLDAHLCDTLPRPVFLAPSGRG